MVTDPASTLSGSTSMRPLNVMSLDSPSAIRNSGGMLHTVIGRNSFDVVNMIKIGSGKGHAGSESVKWSVPCIFFRIFVSRYRSHFWVNVMSEEISFFLHENSPNSTKIREYLFILEIITYGFKWSIHDFSKIGEKFIANINLLI